MGIKSFTISGVTDQYEYGSLIGRIANIQFDSSSYSLIFKDEEDNVLFSTDLSNVNEEVRNRVDGAFESIGDLNELNTENRGSVVSAINELNRGILEASSSALMVNTGAIYRYTGTEDGYETGYLYYYNGTSWVAVNPDVFSVESNGLVPKPTQIEADEKNYLTANGDWETPSIGYKNLDFGTMFENTKGWGLTECKTFVKLNGAITGVLHGWAIPVKEGDTLVLDGFEITTRNGHYGVEIYTSATITEDETKGLTFGGTGRILHYSESPTSDGKFPITEGLGLTETAMAWIQPRNTFSSATDDYTAEDDPYTYPQDVAIYISNGEEEDENGISKWYKDTQEQSLVVSSDYNKTLYWSLFQAVSGLVNANCLVLGDSLTEISAKDRGVNAGEGNRPYYGYGWFTRIARKYNMTCDIYGRSSARWWTQESGGSTQHSCCTDVAAICADTSLDADNYQYIIIEYGTNDIWFGHDNFGTLADVASNAVHTTTVSAVRYCIESLQTKFTGAKIIVIMPTIIKDTLQEYQKNYYTIIDQVLDEYGIKRVYPRYEAGITLAMMRDDGVHLDKWENNTHINNVEAVKRFSECLEGGMLSI